VLSDGLLASQTASGVKSVFAPKLNGLNNLANATFAAALRGVAAFSSVAAFIGSAGQASYAARLSEMQASGLPGPFPFKAEDACNDMILCLQRLVLCLFSDCASLSESPYVDYSLGFLYHWVDSSGAYIA